MAAGRWDFAADFAMGTAAGLVIVVALPAMNGAPMRWDHLGWIIDHAVQAVLIGALFAVARAYVRRRARSGGH